MRKSLAFIQRNDGRFAVGDFYPVLSVLSHHELGTTTSPFLLLDHLGPGVLAENSVKKGVNAHPHRGFETVTFMFNGEIEHQDTSGGGVIYAGDVQWMTAGAGIVHQEHFSPEFRKRGGRFDMVQLWINLPSQHKLVPARYQSLFSVQIPVVDLSEGQGKIRVIAGKYGDHLGPAQTYSPIQILDIYLKAGVRTILPAQHGDTTLIYLCSGQLKFDEQEEVLEEQGLAVVSSLGEGIELMVLQDSHLLLLNGVPLNEPLVAHGPFVMNSYEEILKSYEAFKNGEFGQA